MKKIKNKKARKEMLWISLRAFYILFHSFFQNGLTVCTHGVRFFFHFHILEQPSQDRFVGQQPATGFVEPFNHGITGEFLGNNGFFLQLVTFFYCIFVRVLDSA